MEHKYTGFKPMSESDKNSVLNDNDNSGVLREHHEAIEFFRKEIINLKATLKDLVTQHQFKIDRMSLSLKRSEEMQGYIRQEMARQYAELSGKINERRIADSKMNDLIDRHNSVVASFETRMLTLKKAVDEKEMRFLKLKSDLESTQQELQKFKKTNT